MSPSSNKPALGVKSKRKLKKSEFLLETLIKNLSACKISPWKHIRGSHSKINKIDASKLLFRKHFQVLTLFFFCLRLPGLSFWCENLQALKTFVKVYQKEIGIFWFCFQFFLNLLFTQAHLISGVPCQRFFYFMLLARWNQLHQLLATHNILGGLQYAHYCYYTWKT